MMFAKFLTEEMIVICVVELEEDTRMMNFVRSLKLQDSINPMPLKDKPTNQQPIELSITDPSPDPQEPIEPDNLPEQPIEPDNPPQS